jgi:hypothetical protein
MKLIKNHACSSHGRFLGVFLLYEHIVFQTASWPAWFKSFIFS